MEDLNFKNRNPGAVQFGNFINYYQFHPPEYRISLLPKHLWSLFSLTNGNFSVLDIGCNSGDLTIALYNFLTEIVGIKNCNILGIDIDPILIQRASEKTINNKNFTFKCADITQDESQQIITNYLTEKNSNTFHIVFCFSITMWIHLNHGDSGLYEFLRQVTGLGEYLVIEPQPWKCYRAAVKRLKLEQYEFTRFAELNIKHNVEEEIEKFIIQICGLKKISESQRTKWNRKLLFFKRVELST